MNLGFGSVQEESRLQPDLRFAFSLPVREPRPRFRRTGFLLPSLCPGHLSPLPYFTTWNVSLPAFVPANPTLACCTPVTRLFTRSRLAFLRTPLHVLDLPLVCKTSAIVAHTLANVQECPSLILG